MGGLVLQEWVGALSWKQQSIVLSSLRGPDNLSLPNLKLVSRWIRGVVQRNADSSSKYMNSISFPNISGLREEVEFCSVHYLGHLLQGLEVIGYNHPDQLISREALGCYSGIVERVLHLNVESKSQLETRLRDIEN